MNVARVTDVHKGVCNHGQICCPHNVAGKIVSGSSDIFTNGLSQARDGDTVTHDCPHCGTGIIVASSASVMVNGRLIARIGDSVVYPGGEGKIISASEDVNAG